MEGRADVDVPDVAFPTGALIEAADLRIEIEAVQEGDDVSLMMTLNRTDRAEPARDLTVRLRPEAGRPVDAQTDAEGRIQIAFPTGASQLEIRGEFPIAFDLERPD